MIVIRHAHSWNGIKNAVIIFARNTGKKPSSMGRIKWGICENIQCVLLAPSVE
jgi:hypothetical protein